MADARINETVFLYADEYHADWFGDVVGVVLYSNTFNPNGVQIMMVPR